MAVTVPELKNNAAAEPQQIRYDGIHCNLIMEQFPNGTIVLRISGTDTGEFADVPLKVLNQWIAGRAPFDFFIDARDVRGASIAVSAEWAVWLSAQKQVLRSVTMLTGSRFIQVTAEFVRRFANLEGAMMICTEPAVFDHALAGAVKLP
ncbi:MAG TPA: hypothetical protein VHW09_01615 [Bryobacteraceae bacterium]|jgi:hypothetical protein|nr:hypothetical protein [Bryobacteraceae bacterium]